MPKGPFLFLSLTFTSTQPSIDERSCHRFSINRPHQSRLFQRGARFPFQYAHLSQHRIIPVPLLLTPTPQQLFQQAPTDSIALAVNTRDGSDAAKDHQRPSRRHEKIILVGKGRSAQPSIGRKRSACAARIRRYQERCRRPKGYGRDQWIAQETVKRSKCANFIPTQRVIQQGRRDGISTWRLRSQPLDAFQTPGSSSGQRAQTGWAFDNACSSIAANALTKDRNASAILSCRDSYYLELFY